MKWIEMLKEIKKDHGLLDSRPDLTGMGEESQVFKAYLAMKQEGAEEGTLIATISTKAKDAYGDIVEPKGGDFNRWRKNPVVMWAHDYKIPPIGRGLWIKTDSETVISKCEYAPSEFAQQIYSLSIPSKQNGGKPWIQGWSIGFLPTEAEWITEKDDNDEDKRTGGIRFLKWELLEYSACPIPANPEALTNAIVKGILKVENKDILKQLQDVAAQDSTTVRTPTFKYCVCKDCGYWEKKKAGKPCQDKKCPECGKPLMGSNDKPKKEVEGQSDDPEKTYIDLGDDTIARELGGGYIQLEEVEPVTLEHVLKPYPNEHSCRLKDPDAFDSDSFKRVKRKHDGKEYSVIMGKLKGEDTMTEQAYRYPKDIWTEAEAKKHCKDHKGIKFEPASKEVVDVDAAAEAKKKAEINDLIEGLKAQIEGHLQAVEKIEDKESEEYAKAVQAKEQAEKELQLILDCKGECDIQVTSAGKKEKSAEQKKDKLTVAVKIDGMEIVQEFKERLEKAGAVLNKANKDKLKKASDLVLEVLASAEKGDNDKAPSEPEPKKEKPEETDILSQIKIEDKAPAEKKLEATAEEVSTFKEGLKKLFEETNGTIRGVVKQEVRKLLGKVDI